MPRNSGKCGPCTTTQEITIMLSPNGCKQFLPT